MAGENVANKTSGATASTEQTTAAAAQNPAGSATSAANAPVEKVKGHRPKVSHHESVLVYVKLKRASNWLSHSDKIKQAFHIKDKHDRSTGSKAIISSEV